MVYEIIFKKRFRNKLEKLLVYIAKEFGLAIAKRLSMQLEKKFDTFQKPLFIGANSTSIKGVRSIQLGKQNRIYYRFEKDKIIVLNMYDTRIIPVRNKLK